ncbi:O-antigen ligase family protein [Natribacillus halophilus]|uniref:O-antigen ligase n=1 Tax=Natribacillus halophilus TaxID=549003 RepID=A0A1G8RRI9_9BACI|nr:hypothetical protein [Natribacillus halophilus]SDJ19684.1 hypothetical protein SAMN04488123_12011 [Natribacillus halophilus]
MKGLFIIILMGLMILGALITTEFGENLTFLIYLLYVSMIPLIIFIMKTKKFHINKTVLLLLYGYIILSAISAMVNADVTLIITSMLIMLLYLSLGVALPSWIKNYDGLILKITVISLSALVFIPLLINGIDESPYQGMFYNTNSFGVVVATLFTAILALFFNDLERHFMGEKISRLPKSKFLMYTGLIITCFIFVTLSGSRTSFLTCVFLLVLGSSLFVVFLIKRRKIGSLIIRIPFLSFVVFILGYLTINFTNFGLYLEENILSKFASTSGRGDLFNNRSGTWETILTESGLFNESIDQLFITPHNTFLSILSTNGWLPFMFLALFFVVCLCYAISYFFKSGQSHRYFPILAISSFILLSMAEIMLYKSSMIMAFAAIGLAVNNQVVKLEK